MSGVLSHAAAQSVRASVHHAQRSPTWHPVYSGGTHPAVPQVLPRDMLHLTHWLIKPWIINFSRVAFFWFRSDPSLADNTKQGLNKILADEVPIEVKPVNPADFYRRVPMEPKKLFWVRSKGHIGKPSEEITPSLSTNMQYNQNRSCRRRELLKIAVSYSQLEAIIMDTNKL